MSVTVAADPAARVIRFTLTGALTTDEMLHALAEGERAAGNDGYRVLSDHRAVTTAIKPQQMEHVLAFLARPDSRFRGNRCAIVVSNEVSYGMMRILAARVEPLDMAVQIFERLEDAESWLAWEGS